MKKTLLLLSLILIIGCNPDEIITPIDDTNVEIPESLVIDDIQGLKLESTIVSDEVRMNTKLPYTGIYRIKIRDISKQLISQEKINGNEGDNLLKVYVSSLERDGYIIELSDEAHNILGLTTFVVN
jgi:hypothetical protein